MNVDNFGARYYASTMGRFMTPDWSARPTTVPYAMFGDPQSLNLYAYVRNDPVSRADLDGHWFGFQTGGVLWWYGIWGTPAQTNNQPQTKPAQNPGQDANVPGGCINATCGDTAPNSEQANTVAPPIPWIPESVEIGVLAPFVAPAIVVGYLISPGTQVDEGERAYLAFLENQIPASVSQEDKVDTSAAAAKEHSKGKSKSKWNKHTKRRPGRSTTKDRQKPGFKPRTPPRPQDIEDDSN